MNKVKWIRGISVVLAATAALIGGSLPANAFDPVMHNSSSVGSTKYGVWGKNFTCSTCHQSTLSGGNAKSIAPTVLGRQVIFNTYQSFGTDDGHTTSVKICEVCHTQTLHHRYDNSVNGTNHNGTVNCTTCHLHANGFRRAVGESGGGVACDGCHSDLYLNSSGYGMHSIASGVSYKHYMQNADVKNDSNLTMQQVGTSWYATDIPNGTTQYPSARRCLMCHVDHDQFKSNNKRAYNLRPNVTTVPTSGGMNRDDNLCLSCHNAEKTKAVIGPNNETGVMPIPFPTIAYNNATSVLNNSTHGYPITTTFSDGSTFNAVCAKCHNDSIGRNGESNKSIVKGQKGTFKFGEHNSTVPGRFAILGTDFYQREAIGSGTTITLNPAAKTIQVVPSPGWSADVFQWNYLTITNGGGVGQRALVTTNSADTLTLQSWPTGIDGNTTFDVVDDNLPIDNICLSCHCKNGQDKSSGINRDWYGQQPMSDTLEGIFNIFVGDTGNLPSSVTRRTSFNVTLSLNTWTSTNINGYLLRAPGGRVEITGLTAGPTGTGPYTYTITTATALRSASGPIELIKPASHPLDMNARHESDERVNNAGPGWNKGDQGTTSTANTAGTQITDTSKLWSGSEFNGLIIAFPNLYDANGKVITSTVNGGTANTVSFSPAVTGLTTTGGDVYYIGPRHVSCADCHNPHASFRNPEGKPSVAAGNNTLTDSTHANIPGWYDNIWAGRLLRVRSSAGVEQVRFVTAFNNATGQYTVSLPWTTNPDTTYTYEILMSDQWTLAGQSGGRAGSGSSGIWGVIPTAWRPAPPTAGFNNMTTPVSYRKIENVFDNMSTTGLRGSTVAGQRDLCVRCHSSYAYGAATPMTPSGKANGAIARGTDVSKEFNPNNMAHHAVYARGKNQPLVAGAAGKKNGTVTSSTTTVVTVTGGNFDASYVGKTIVIISGTGQGQARLISAQAATTLTVATAFTTAPTSTSKFVVLDSFNPNWPIYNGLGTGTVTVSNGLATFSGATLPKTTLPGWFLYTFSDNVWREVRTIDSATTFKVTGADITTGTSFILTAGLGNTFVPPFGPWSILRCTDCHGSTKTDPVGPHASVNNWLIKDADSMQFYWFAGGADTNVSLINPGLPTTVAKPLKYFCYNCHRRDVYGDKDMRSPSNYLQSRQPHANYLDTNTNTTNDTKTKWGVHCRLCHAGDRLGGIHGTNLQSTVTPSGAFTNNQGQRFLNGSAWGTHNLGVRRSTTQTAGGCYTSGTILDATVDACGYSHSNQTYVNKATYDY